jgi:4'-phosphopantetheinyl transferase
MENLLSAEEKERASRFRLEAARRDYVVARGLLRVILGRYLKMNPSQLHFSYGPQGKPRLVAFAGHVDLRFNVSHSQGLALFAFTQGREIGVDLECIRTELDREAIAARVLSPTEQQALNGLPAIKRRRAFYRLWTCKEAYVKATGKGLSLELNGFEITLASDGFSAPLRVSNDVEEHSRCAICELNPADNYAAAVVVEGAEWKLACWDWNPSLLRPTRPRRRQLA